jgi:hypothetical protein
MSVAFAQELLWKPFETVPLIFIRNATLFPIHPSILIIRPLLVMSSTIPSPTDTTQFPLLHALSSPQTFIPYDPDCLDVASTHLVYTVS